MLLTFILLLVIIVCLSVAGYIVGSKFYALRVMDVETVAEEKVAVAKDRMLEDRLSRAADKGKKVVGLIFRPIGKLMKNIFSKVAGRFRRLEQSYQKPKAPLSQAEKAVQIASLLREAQSFLKDEQYGLAEKKLIEIISLDSLNIAAYQELAKLYLLTKEYKQARDTYHYILKLTIKNSQEIIKQDDEGKKYKVLSNSHELVEALSDLGEVYEIMGKYNEALNCYQKSLKLEPNHPKNLAQMINLCIMMKNKILAFDTLKKLEEVNPENQKLGEYRSKIAEI